MRMHKHMMPTYLATRLVLYLDSPQTHSSKLVSASTARHARIAVCSVFRFSWAQSVTCAYCVALCGLVFAGRVG